MHVKGSKDHRYAVQIASCFVLHMVQIAHLRREHVNFRRIREDIGDRETTYKKVENLSSRREVHMYVYNMCDLLLGEVHVRRTLLVALIYCI